MEQSVLMLRRDREPFGLDDALRWARKHPVEGVSIAKSIRAARRLPSSALPAMFRLVAEGTGKEVHAALMVLMVNRVKMESDGTEDHEPTWRKATLPNGTILTWPDEDGRNLGKT
jgi:hypothetical protein